MHSLTLVIRLWQALEAEVAKDWRAQNVFVVVSRPIECAVGAALGLVSSRKLPRSRTFH